MKTTEEQLKEVADEIRMTFRNEYAVLFEARMNQERDEK